MTNQIRGVISEEILGERLALRLSANEWCELEDEHGKSTDEILKDFVTMVQDGNLRVTLLRSLFRASLAMAKPGITLDEAGNLMAEIGLPEAGRIVGEVIKAALPEAEAGPPTKGAPGKRKPPVSPRR